MADAEGLAAAANPAPGPAPATSPQGWQASVYFRQRPVTSRWADFEWETAAVAPDASSANSVTGPVELAEAGGTRWRYDGALIDLHPSEGEGYWLNLNSPAPCIFVMWRLEDGDSVPRPVVVTVSYNEAGRMLDAGEHVDNVPMPDEMRGDLVAYTAEHYKPEPRRKVRRNDPFKDGAFRRQDGAGTAGGPETPRG